MWSCLVLIYFLLIFLPLLVPETSKFRYYACYISYALFFTFLSFVYIVLYFFTKDHHNYCIKRFVMKFSSFILGYELFEKGLENVDTSAKAIIVSNHQSSLDVLLFCQVFVRYRSCTAIAKKEVAYFGTFGLAAYLRGYIFIDRRNKELAIKKISDGTDKHFKEFKNGKVLLFPEGTRNKLGGELLEFKKGAFFLAIEKQVQIVPVVVSPLKFIKSHEYFKKGRIIISYLKPIPTEGMTSKDVDVLVEKTKKVMKEEYQKLFKEV